MMNARQHYEAGVTAHQQGRMAEAEAHYRGVLAEAPEHAGALHGLGVLCVQTGRVQEAFDLLQRAAAANPLDPLTRHHLGLMLLRLGRASEAAAEFERAVALKPDFPEAYKSLGDAHRRSGRFEQAVRAYETALAAAPNQPAALMGMGDAQSVLGRTADALRSYEAVLRAAPGHAPAHYGIGTVMQQLGRFEEARCAFERAVALAPRVATFHRALAEIEKFRPGDPRLDALEKLAAERLPDEQASERDFALAKAYDDLGWYDDAFERLRLANAVKRRMVGYDEAGMLQTLENVARTFTAEAIALRAGTGHPSEHPVFVVGMPRSGTSLIEQILASHPDVFAAGELTLVPELICERFAGHDYPSRVPSAATLREFGAAYAAHVAALAPGARRIVDKLPGNFAHLGLIHLALPNARIIHVRRDPRDTCLSCYSKLFLNGLNYTYDLAELGRYHKAYQELMAHWRAVLPEGTMSEVDYERVVERLEDESRRLVGFCGLDWDARCLAFHQTERAVRTHSEVQVRQPLFNTSVGRWRHYERHLEPLIAALR